MAALEVIALDTSVPQLMAPQAGDTYTFPRAVEMPLGTANGVLYLDGSKVVTSGIDLVFNATGLGIGTTPTAKLDLLVNDGLMAYFRSSGGLANDKRLTITSGGDRVILDAANNSSGTAAALAFTLGGSEAMRLNSTGLGIGTSSPTQKLDVAGQIKGTYLSLDDDAYLYFGDGTARIAGSGASEYLSFVTSGSERLRLDSSGNLGLGVTPSAWATVTPVIEMKNGVHFATLDTGTPLGYLGANAYYNGSNWIYKVSSNYATRYELNSGGNGSHAWFTAPSGTAGNVISFTQSLAVGKGTTLALEGAVPNSGTGITFPATQNPSSNANTLDDYEEGTWTPVVRGSGTAGTYELSTAEGSYVKIGKQVTLSCRVVFAAAITGGGTGYLQITGAPAFNNAAVAYGPVSQSGLDMTTNYTWLTASFINTSGTTILYLEENGDNVSSSDFPISGVSANDSIRFSITYITTA